MTRWLPAVLTSLSYLMVSSFSVAYDFRTHALLAGQSIDASTATRSYFEDVGLSPERPLDFDLRTPSEQLARFENTGTPRDWVIEGVIREDDFVRRQALEDLGCTRSLNPPTVIDRPLNHFFDVQRGGRGLTVPPIQGLPAPDWALGEQGRGPGPTQNQFSVLDARVYQFRSLAEPTREGREHNAALLFRSLGQAIHVLQDMGQPQHTRNDPHAGCIQPISGEHSWYEAYIEARATGTVFGSRDAPPDPLDLHSHPPATFLAYREYFTEPGRQGLADFSSRNFFSSGTNLSARGNCSGLPEPPCLPEAYQQEVGTFTFRTKENGTITGQVTFLKRTMTDPVTGTSIPDVRVTSRSLWDQHLESRGLFPVFSLNTLNYDSISDVLLPLAVGYSAGFLDYFFRGRLDLDVKDDPDHPDALRVEATNASSEALGAGTITVYGEDANGARTPAGAPVAVGEVAPGEALPPVTVAGSDQVARLVAVYQGTLGRETAAPSGDPPGAVVARVVETPGAEELFSDGTRWQLRSPRGVFPLPILTADVEDLRWGDVDNTLVGRSPMGLGQPNRFTAYRLNRPPGTRDVPLGAPDGSGVRLVDLAVTRTVAFPADLDTGTSVNFKGSNTVTYDLLTFEARQPLFFDRFLGEYFATPMTTADQSDMEEASDLQVTRQLDETLSLNPVFQIVLSLDKYKSSGRPLPYQWTVREIGLDPRGHIVALVEVMLTSPENSERTVVARIHDEQTGALRPYFPHTLRVAFPISTLLFATVDLDTRTVVTTASSTFAPVMSSTQIYTVVQKHVTGVAQDGPLQGQTLDLWDVVFPRPADEVPPESIVMSGGHITLVLGLTEFRLPGWYRDEIRARVETPVFVAETAGEGALLYAIVRPSGSQPPVYRTYGQQASTFGAPQTPTVLRQAHRQRPAPAGDQVLLFGRPRGFATGESAVLLSWKPPANPLGSGTATLAEPPEFPPAFRNLLAGATSRRALLVSDDLTGTTSRLVDLQRRTSIDITGQDLATRFVLLDPGFLYSIEDLRFHHPDQSLAPSGLPARLADAPGNPVGDYHLIRNP